LTLEHGKEKSVGKNFFKEKRDRKTEKEKTNSELDKSFSELFFVSRGWNFCPTGWDKCPNGLGRLFQRAGTKFPSEKIKNSSDVILFLSEKYLKKRADRKCFMPKSILLREVNWTF
jgi:hypothetical protein